MRWRHGAVVALVVWIGASGCATPPPTSQPAAMPGPKPSPRRYELRLKSSPDDSEVHIAGRVVGRTPFVWQGDEPVALDIVVRAVGHAPGRLSTDAAWWRHSTAARAAQRYGRHRVVRSAQLQLERRRALRVTSDPPGAVVTVAGIGHGRTPIVVPWAHSQTAHVALMLEGYVPWGVEVDSDWWSSREHESRIDPSLDAFVTPLHATLWRPSAVAWSAAGRSDSQLRVRVRRGGLHQKLDARVYGPRGSRDVTFLYDTGATYTTIDRETARAIGLPIADAQVRIQAQTANGVIDNPVVIVPEMSLSGIELENVTVLLCDACRQHDVVGLLGLNVIREFSTQVSDDGRELILTRSSSNAGRHLSMQAFLDVESAATNAVVLVNQSGLAMTDLVVELTQSRAAVKVGPMHLPARKSLAVPADLRSLTPGEPFTIHIIDGTW